MLLLLVVWLVLFLFTGLISIIWNSSSWHLVESSNFSLASLLAAKFFYPIYLYFLIQLPVTLLTQSLNLIRMDDCSGDGSSSVFFVNASRHLLQARLPDWLQVSQATHFCTVISILVATSSCSWLFYVFVVVF